jgi:type IV pilus assembly protein PilC
MLYHYSAVDKSGKTVEGDLEASDVSRVLQHLSSQELRPIGVRAVSSAQRAARHLFGGISISDKVFITKYLALMLRVGTDLLSAIDILIADFDKPAVKNLLLEVRDSLSSGRPFYEAFARYPKTFSPVFINLVRAAEASGNLQQTFEGLSKSLQEEVELHSRIRSALVYPIILLVTSIVITGFLITFAIPRIAKVFLDSGIRPPLFSRVVFGIGLFINDHLFLFITVAVAVLAVSVYFFGWHPIGRRLLSRALSKMPVIRTVYRELAIQRFAATFSSLMRAGLPIIQTTKITAEVAGADEFRDSLRRIADEGLAKGMTIGEAFRRETVFPRVVTNLISISEKAGHLEEVLETLAAFYAADIDGRVRSLVAVLEPLLLMLMGGLVGIIAVAIIVPIYQLSTQF